MKKYSRIAAKPYPARIKIRRTLSGFAKILAECGYAAFVFKRAEYFLHAPFL